MVALRMIEFYVWKFSFSFNLNIMDFSRLAAFWIFNKDIEMGK